MQSLAKLLESLSQRKISRREFLRFCFFGFVGLLLSREFFNPRPVKAAGFNARKKKNIKGNHDLVVADGDDPYLMARRAIEAMGGMGRFVKSGDTVVIKPNIGWDRAPEYAANTNPAVVAALVELCFEAGAKRVNVFDISCNSAQRSYASSGIQKAAQDKGARVYFADDWNVIKAQFDYSSPMEGWPIFRDAVDCEVFINVPILKHHGLTTLTLSMKNLMGVCTGSRGMIHSDIGRKLVDLTDFINPDLTVIDAYKVLVRNGPTGGNLDDVVKMGKLIVATDPTLADVYACKLAGKEPMSISCIAEAVRRGFGSTDVDNADILKISV